MRHGIYSLVRRIAQRTRPLRRRNRKASRLGMEGLENRQLMAGDVAVSVVGDDLNVTSGAGDQSFSIAPARYPGMIEIRATDAETTINGGVALIVDGRAVRDLNIKTGSGDDSVAIVGSAHGQRLQIDELFANLQKGDDSISVVALAANDIDIETRKGDDSVYLDAVAARHLDIATGRHEDNVHLSRTYVNGSTRLNLGAGHDQLHLRQVGLQGTVVVKDK